MYAFRVTCKTTNAMGTTIDRGYDADPQYVPCKDGEIVITGPSLTVALAQLGDAEVMAVDRLGPACPP